MKKSELILNDRGAIYHLDLKPEDVADIIITVGDPQRVKKVSQYFDTIDFKRKKREFKTHTGTLNGKRITVLSTGIGTGNIDIVFNELDALFNVDLESREVKKQHTPLQLVRIGTSGALQADIPVDSFVVNTAAIGIDGLGLYYGKPNQELNKQFPHRVIDVYTAQADEELLNKVGYRMLRGTAITAGGFYAPQGRSIRIPVDHQYFIDELIEVKTMESRVTNMEMETAGIYLLAELLGHEALSCNAILANRITGEFSTSPGETVDRLIRQVLQELTS